MTSLAELSGSPAGSPMMPMTDVLLSQLASLRNTLVGIISLYTTSINSQAAADSCYKAIQTCVDAFVSRLSHDYNLDSSGGSHLWRLKLVVLTLQYLRRDNTISHGVAVRLMAYFQPPPTNIGFSAGATTRRQAPPPVTTALAATPQNNTITPQNNNTTTPGHHHVLQWQYHRNQQKIQELQQQQRQQHLIMVRTQQQLRHHQNSVRRVSLGRTPSLSVATTAPSSTSMITPTSAAVGLPNTHTRELPRNAPKKAPPSVMVPVVATTEATTTGGPALITPVYDNHNDSMVTNSFPRESRQQDAQRKPTAVHPSQGGDDVDMMDVDEKHGNQDSSFTVEKETGTKRLRPTTSHLVGDDKMDHKKTKVTSHPNERQILGELDGKANATTTSNDSMPPPAARPPPPKEVELVVDSDPCIARNRPRRNSTKATVCAPSTPQAEKDSAKKQEPTLPPPPTTTTNPKSVSMSMIPALLSSHLSSSDKDTILQAYDDFRQSQTDIETSRQALEEAQRALCKAEKRHEQQLAASVAAKAVLQGWLGKVSDSAVATAKAPRVKGARKGNRKQPMVL